jgi:hypothetical protein
MTLRFLRVVWKGYATESPRRPVPNAYFTGRPGRLSREDRTQRAEENANVPEYAFDSSEGLVESLLGRQLIPDGEHPLMRAARGWLKKNGCPQAPHARGRGRYLVPPELARRFATECWPEIKQLAVRSGGETS